MDKLLIEGGPRLAGEVDVAGAKNSALPVLAACLLTAEPCRLANVPEVRDLMTMRKLLDLVGARTQRVDGVLEVEARAVSEPVAPYDLVRTMRASAIVLGPLLARTGRAAVSLPGGCAIGARPMNLHLEGLAKMGARLELEGGYIRAEAEQLVGTTIEWTRPSVTGTENLMMAAVLARGVTRIKGAALEPEVVDLAQMLERMGAHIVGAGTPEIRIEGVERLHGVEHTIMPDRIEAGTLLVAAAITGGDVLVRGARAEHLEAVLAKLSQSGAAITRSAEGIRLRMDGAPRPVDVTTLPFPGFPTDMQAQLTSLVCLAPGTSAITETIFESRFMHVSELERMGARIDVQGPTAFVDGVERLTAAPVMATDLRASAALVLAGLAADGVTEIRRVYHLDRGYAELDRKLIALGARIRRVAE
ncbi:MAG: UDP-N-acetylglucosamine 1-carboxyvinyltransferase [bacterium]